LVALPNRSAPFALFARRLQLGWATLAGAKRVDHPLIREWQFIKSKNRKDKFMGLFNSLMSKIFGHAAQATTASASQAAAAAPAAGGTPQTPAAAGSSAPAPAAAPAASVVDVAAVLNDLAKKNPEKLDWRKSIVDLMKLVGMDSSLAARKQLATELHYTGDLNDSASMNVWLHKEVLKKLAENGGKVPPELLG
jgi:Domain of unknown function (DUF3597)